jgi:Icc-related predicted phosphoesterase
MKNSATQLLTTLFVCLLCMDYAPAQSLTFAVWSDTHFGAYDFTDTTRLDIIEQINTIEHMAPPEGFAAAVHPEFLLHCGDITEKGTPLQWNDPNITDQRSYIQTLHHLDSQISTFAALGNHDSRKAENIRHLFAQRYGGTYYAFDCKGVHFVVLDPYTQMNSAAPSLDSAQIEWLKADLSKLSPKTPVIIVMHVLPIVDKTIDRTSRLDEESSLALSKAVAGSHVLAFLHGHWHARSINDWNGIPVIAPAGFAYERKGCPNGHPYLGIIRITNAEFTVYGYNWQTRSFDPAPFFHKSQVCVR